MHLFICTCTHWFTQLIFSEHLLYVEKMAEHETDKSPHSHGAYSVGLI